MSTTWPLATADDADAEHAALRPEFECVTDVDFVDGVGDACRIYNGLWKIFHSDGVVSYSHGPDPAPHVHDETHAHDDPFEAASHAARAPACVAASSTQYYIHVIYSRPSNKADRYATMAPAIRTMVQKANGHLYGEALATGGTADFRVLCSGSTIVVSNAVLPTSSGSDTFSTITTDLRNLGYNNARHKYWVWHDDGVGGYGGQGTLWNDDRRIVGNYNNGGAPDPTFAITYGYNAWDIMLHELGHNLGAVQSGWQGPPAPGSNTMGHCNDGLDIMCYAEGGQPYNPNVCTGFARWDCNKNTYFHTNPPSGSYLATWWNIGWSANRYISFGGTGNAAPTMTSLTCSPSSSTPGQTVTCSFSASDDSSGVHYTVNWGDGSATTRVPSSGTVAPGTTQSAGHVFSAAGAYTVSVTATDNGSPALTSGAREVQVDVQGAGCLSRTGTLLVGLAGLRVEGVSSRTESGIPAACAGRSFTLEGSIGSDFDICWFADTTQLACMNALGSESGTVPSGATVARVTLYAGAAAQYRLTVS